jgi:RNA polymerase sigma-70 factor (ECF subfamily)
MHHGDSHAGFPATRWSWVAAAGDPASPGRRAALAELCRAYWYPVYAFIRRRGHSPSDAADLAQDYFARLLDGGLLRAANPARGKFRTFLRTDCGFFLSDQHDRSRAVKRGGHVRHVPFDANLAESRYAGDAAVQLDPDRQFDRAWAAALLDQALARLQKEEAYAGRGARFQQLKGLLVGGPEAPSYSDVASATGTAESTLHAAVARLRRRYRDALQLEVAATLDNPTDEEIAAEIRDMFESFAR